MKALRWTLVLAAAVGIATLLVTRAVPAAEEPGADARLGEDLVRTLWANLKNADTEAMDKMLAPGFQSVHQDGARTRAQELALIKDLNLGEYVLSDFRITRNGPVIVATYRSSAQETIDGKVLSKKPEPRLTVFLKTDAGWQWMAHANLKPIQEPKK